MMVEKRKIRPFWLLLPALIAGLLAARAWLADVYAAPILMYHHVRDLETWQSDTVSPENLERQILFLKRNGYAIVPLSELIEWSRQKDPVIPRKTVALSFDDGYEDNYTKAFPVLLKHGVPAIFFISPDQIGEQGFMTPDQVREMRDAGMDFGSHGMSQAYLPGVPPAEQVYEIFNSKKVLEGDLHTTVSLYAYPVGGFSDEIKRMVKEAGYSGAVTTNRGHDRRNRDVYEMNRIKFSNKDDTSLELWAKLSGYYNSVRRLKAPY